jgi:hypothetical protein
MKQISLSVPEEKYDFFMELLNSMDFISLDDFPEIPDEHKNLVIERKRTSSPDSIKNWDDVKHQFKID